RHAKLAPNHIVMSAEVTDYVDALDVYARTLVDHVSNVHDVVHFVAVEARLDLAEGVALLRHGGGQSLDSLLDLVSVIDPAGAGEDVAVDGIDIERGQVGLDVDRAEAVALPLLDGESNEEATTVAIEVGGGRNDACVGITVLHVELPQQLTIQIEPIGVVNVGALEETQQIRLRGRDDETQLRVAEGRVADEIDGPNLGGRALIDLEHHVDAVIVEIDDLGFHLRGIKALAPVEVEDALDVGLHPGSRIDRAGLELDLRRQGVVLDLFVALEGHAIDDRVFDQGDDEGRPLFAHADVLEQTCGKQGLQRIVDFGGIVRVTRGEGQVGTNRLRLDALIAFDANAFDGTRILGISGLRTYTHAGNQRKRDSR